MISNPHYREEDRRYIMEELVLNIEEEAKSQGYKIKTGTFPLAASGKALGLGDTDGFSKLIFSISY